MQSSKKPLEETSIVAKQSNQQKKKLIHNKFFRDVIKYTILYSFIISFILYIFLKYRKGFIWQSDGLNQHFVTLNYFSDLLKNFIATGDFSTFIWNIGNGIDMFGNLAYYIFGDPVSYFCIFIPKDNLHIFYYAIVLIRIYFIGISFLCFCKYKKINKGNVIGSLMYTFCIYVLYAGVRHPYFMNALILFPLLMIGIEKIILEDKKVFYTIIIAITCISNFYFAYSLFLIIAIYGVILTIYNYKKEGIKFIVKKLLKVLRIQSFRNSNIKFYFNTNNLCIF